MNLVHVDLQISVTRYTLVYGVLFTFAWIKRPRSPEHAEVINPESKVRAVECSYSPASYATKTETPRRGVEANVTGRVTQKFGSDVETWKNENQYTVKINKTMHRCVPQDQMYMFDILSRRMEIMENYCCDMGTKIFNLWPANIKEMITTPNVVEAVQELFRTFGRIKCERNAGSYMLQNWYIPEDEEDEEKSANQRNGCSVAIALDLSKLKQYSIFPGQIVAVEATNPGTETLIVKEMRSIVSVKPTPPPEFNQPMQIIVACGPFTKQDRLDFQPLMNLMQNVTETEPNLLILVGPFVPHDNDDIKKSTIVDSFQEVFENLVGKIVDYVKGTSTQVVLMASHDDAHHDNVYPTPEYIIPPFLKHPNIHTISDPCMFSVEGLSIGATSVDILKHLAGKEINHNMAGSDRVGRLAEHILHQACFYPLYPPSKKINMDTEVWEKYAIMEYRPHILLLPSSLKHFCKWSDNTFILNPGDLSKNLYARLKIRPGDKGWSSTCVDCEILKI